MFPCIMDTLLLDHVPKELCTLILAYSELERCEYGNTEINVYFSCCFGHFHGTVSMYVMDNDKHTFTGFHQLGHAHTYSKLINIYKEKKPFIKQNNTLMAVYQFEHGILCGKQIHYDINNKLVSSYTFKNGRKEGPGYSDSIYDTYESMYEDDRKHGFETHTDKGLLRYDGKSIKAGNYDRGMKNGEWTCHTTIGNFMVTYKNDVEMNRIFTS